MKKKKGKNKERPSRIEKYEYLNRKKKTIELEKKKNLEEKKEQRRQNLKKRSVKIVGIFTDCLKPTTCLC